MEYTVLNFLENVLAHFRPFLSQAKANKFFNYSSFNLFQWYGGNYMDTSTPELLGYRSGESCSAESDEVHSKKGLTVANSKTPN